MPPLIASRSARDCRLKAEWEYAARAGAQTHHHWGEEIDGRYLWYRANTNGRPGKVARKLPNRWGLYDDEGNAWEWVAGGGPHSGVTLPGHGFIRGGGWMTCPEPYPPTNGVRSRQTGLGVVFENFARQNFKADWRRDDSGLRSARWSLRLTRQPDAVPDCGLGRAAIARSVSRGFPAPIRDPGPRFEVRCRGDGISAGGGSGTQTDEHPGAAEDK